MDISRIIQEDLNAALSAFRDDDFRLMNIYANRIMSNAILGEDPMMMLPGFFLKEMSRIYGIIKAKKGLATFSTAKSLGETYVKSMRWPDGETKDVWREYHDFYVRISDHQMDEHEKGSYTVNHEFTKHAFRFFIQKMSEDRTFLLNEHNRLVQGTLNELDRIFKVHKGDMSGLYTISLVRALQLYSNYMPYYDKEERGKVIESSMFSYIDEIRNILQGESIDPRDITVLLSRILHDWRMCYVHFMEAPSIIPVPAERRVPIAEETKEKISDAVAKALEEEVR